MIILGSGTSVSDFVRGKNRRSFINSFLFRGLFRFIGITHKSNIASNHYNIMVDVTEGLDRIIILINDMTIQGNTRMQKYGFLTYQQYAKKQKLAGLNFYEDWKPYLYGPYSQQLKDDLERAIASKLIAKYVTTTPSNREFSNYSLTVKGRLRLRKLSERYRRVIQDLYEKFTKLNRTPMQTILKDIYLAYPQFTVNSEIRDEIMNND